MTQVSNNKSQLKDKGNKEFLQKHYQQSINTYTEAIKQYPSCAILFSNRCQAYLQLAQQSEQIPNQQSIYKHALNDAESSISLDKQWFKAYYRKSQVLLQMDQYQLAIDNLQYAIDHLQENTKELILFKQQIIKNQKEKEDKQILEHKEFMQGLGKFALDNNVMPNFNDIQQWQSSNKNENS